MLTAYEKFKAKIDAYAVAVRPTETTCWLFHRWDRWQQVVKHFERMKIDGQWHKEAEVWQARMCLRCGFRQDRKL